MEARTGGGVGCGQVYTLETLAYQESSGNLLGARIERQWIDTEEKVHTFPSLRL